MNYALDIQPEAELDIQQAHAWHEDQQRGLGERFYDELLACFDHITADPLLRRVTYRGLRKRKLDRFPYLVFYRVAGETISIVCVVHAARHPLRWRRRA